MEFARPDIRKLIYYCWKRGLRTTDIEKEINATLGQGTVSERTCFDWVKKFKAGDFDVSDQPRSGRPSYDIKEEIQAILDENHHASLRDMAIILDVDKETVRNALLKMGKRYLATSWIPYALSEENKEKRMEFCRQLLAMHQRRTFLHQLITVDETWVFWKVSLTRITVPGTDEEMKLSQKQSPTLYISHDILG
jgi:transposase